MQDDKQPLSPLGGLCMYAGHQLGVFGVLLVVLQEKLPCLLIQR